MNRRRCEDCNIEIHKSSYRRHLRSEKHIIEGLGSWLRKCQILNITLIDVIHRLEKN